MLIDFLVQQQSNVFMGVIFENLYNSVYCKRPTDWRFALNIKPAPQVS